MSCVESASEVIFLHSECCTYLFTLFMCNGCNGTKNVQRERERETQRDIVFIA